MARVALLVALALPAGAGGSTAQEMTWDPATAQIVYTAQVEGNSELVLSTEQGPLNLTHNAAQDHAASWSPDGHQIAFQSMRDGNREIYLMDAAGNNVRNLTQHPAQDLLPRFSPDGTRILFFSDRAAGGHPATQLPGDLFVLDLQSGESHRLTTTSLTSTFGGDWAPDSGTVVFARDFDGDIDLVFLDVATGEERRVPGTAAAEYGATYSPDGSQLALHEAHDSGESRIIVMELDGSNRRTITAGAQHYSPTWSPDGRWLLFTAAPLGAAQFDLEMVPAAGGDIVSRVGGEGDERSGAWRPAASAPE